jgi:hypothetical protein
MCICAPAFRTGTAGRCVVQLCTIAPPLVGQRHTRCIALALIDLNFPPFSVGVCLLQRLNGKEYPRGSREVLGVHNFIFSKHSDFHLGPYPLADRSMDFHGFHWLIVDSTD